MIYYSGLDSVIESIYLNDNIFNKYPELNVEILQKFDTIFTERYVLDFKLEYIHQSTM